MLRENVSAASKLFVQNFLRHRGSQGSSSAEAVRCLSFLADGKSEHCMASPTATPLTMVDGCVGCKNRSANAFCNLPGAVLRELERVSFAVSYPEHAILFTEEQTCKGVFLVCAGKVKISARAHDGKEFMLRAAVSGDILGLSATLTGRAYEFSARTLAPSSVRFVKREDFLGIMKSSTEAGLNAVQALSGEYLDLLESLRSVALFPTAAARIAQLLLRLAASTPTDAAPGNNLRLLLTQEQIAQMTGTTRETVTRFFTQLKREEVIELRGSSLVIMDRNALERIAS
jgi:CRP/FNR family transcriptional regulator, cyclic AMP receptor protein